MSNKKTAILFVLAAFSFTAKSQTADEIITKYITFTGGVQNWKKVKTITSSGTYNYGGLEFPFTSISKAPDLYKYVVTFKGKSFSQAYDGKEGWRIDGFKNEKEKTILKDKQATALANESDVELESAFIDYAKKGHTVILEGKDTVDKKLCYKIKLIRKNGDTSTYFFDCGSYALVKKQAVSKNSELDGSMLDIFYSNYLATGGIKVPHKITCRSNGQDVLIIMVKDVKLNLPVSDTIFNP